MAHAASNGIRIAYERAGDGAPILMIMGSGAAGRVWTLHQTPALHRAGYQTVTFDNRGIPPTDAPPGRYTLAELTADTVGLIEALDLGPCRLVGASMGAMIAQELAATRPDLVHSAVLIATRARPDAFRRALGRGERSLIDAGQTLPAPYDAAMSVLHMLSPATLNDETAVGTWLELFEVSGGRGTAAPGQVGVVAQTDRRPQLRGVPVPCRVIAFADDLICPPHLGLEVADAIPDCDYVEIARCGHLGYLEQPDEVNTAIVEFFDKY